MSHDNCPTCGAPFYKAKIARASEWLAERFTERQEWDSRDLTDQARADGISAVPLLAARDYHHISSRRMTDEHGGLYWVWTARLEPST
jgi:hypothetical protein